MKYARLITLSVLAVLSISTFLSVEAIAKDQWIHVRSKNFFLIGNASEKEIRRVGTRLEQFRETFRLLFKNAKLTASIPTNVVVFKNDSSYKPFKPKRADGKIDEFIAGYFQPGEDVNYITLSAEGDDKETFGTIFHEYVHFIIDTNFGRSEVPQWFNEGLAEYYQTFEIEGDNKIKLGLPQGGHLRLLQQNKLVPLETLFNISNYQLHQAANHSRSIFYAQSWALIHFMAQNGKADELNRFLSLSTSGVPARKAFQEAFKTDYEQVEKQLRKYVEASSYKYSELTLAKKLIFDNDMTVSAMDDAVSNAYLGDLLSHSNRPDDAEPYLLASLKQDPNSSLANTALGMVKLKQRKFDESRTLLERAIAGDPKNHIAYYRYAYLLSREGRDEFGFVREFDPALANKMRTALKKAIAIDPTFSESYEMLAFIAVVNNDELDEAIAGLQTALRYQPGNQKYALRIAEIYSRQAKFAEAKDLAEKIARTTPDAETKQRAESLLSNIAHALEVQMHNDSLKKMTGISAGTGGPPRIAKAGDRKKPSEEEIARLQQNTRIGSINEILRAAADGEQRLIGRIQTIDCKKRPLVYSVVAGAEKLSLTSKDFEGLTFSSLDADSGSVQLACDADLSTYNAVLTFKPSTPGTAGGPRGELVAVEFVPADFRFMSADEIKQANGAVAMIERESAIEEMETGRSQAIINAMRGAMRKPGSGEKREMGFLEKVECSGSKAYFHLRTAGGPLKLLNAKPESLRVVYFVQDLAGMRIGCGMKPVEFPAVVVFKNAPEDKGKIAGEVLSLEFVPRSFTLED